MKVAIIPARGGSKRIPRKNIRPFFGKPIMAYSIETALRSKLFDAVYVSTEDPEIGALARTYGAALIHRPPHLAEVNGAPDCGTQEVTGHAITVLRGLNDDIEWACCIYPCAPMVTVGDLTRAAQHAHSTPYSYVYAAGQFYYGLASRFVLNPRDFYYSLRMDREAFVDIDTEFDWAEAERRYAALHGLTAPLAYHPV